MNYWHTEALQKLHTEVQSTAEQSKAGQERYGRSEHRFQFNIGLRIQ